MFENSSEPSPPSVGEICWVQIPVTNMARSQTFYNALFGWKFSIPPGMPEGVTYAMFNKPGTKLEGGMLLVKEGDLIQPMINSEGKGQATNKLTICVDDVNDALKKIEAAGGKIICGKKSLALDMGHHGSFRDTEGNILGIWSAK